MAQKPSPIVSRISDARLSNVGSFVWTPFSRSGSDFINRLPAIPRVSASTLYTNTQPGYSSHLCLTQDRIYDGPSIFSDDYMTQSSPSSTASTQSMICCGSDDADLLLVFPVALGLVDRPRVTVHTAFAPTASCQDSWIRRRLTRHRILKRDPPAHGFAGTVISFDCRAMRLRCGGPHCAVCQRVGPLVDQANS